MIVLKRQRGGLMIEVLVTIFILVVGLMGLLQIQSSLQKTEVEAYQRTQALMLLNDMASRLSVNRAQAASYVTASPLGTNFDCSSIDATTLSGRDQFEWCSLLRGVAEEQAGNLAGGMIGARGCVQELAAGEQYMLTVTWQGLTPISAPPASVTCGADAYDMVSTDCVDNLCRRYMTTVVQIANLSI